MTDARTGPRASVPRRVCAIVVAWNGWAVTRRCLAALRAIEAESLHVVLVDNGSTERMPPEHATMVSRVIRSERNIGFGGGNNLGIELALREGCDYVWLVNNDAFPTAEALAAMIERVEADATIGAVGCVLLNEDGSPQAYGGGRVVRWGGFTRDARDSRDRVDYLTAACLLLREAAVRDVGGFDDGFFMYWEDVDLCARLRRAGWRLAVADEARVTHIGGGSASRLSAKVARWSAEGATIYARRHLRCGVVVSVIALALRVIGLWRRGLWSAGGAAIAGWRDGLRKGRR